MSKAVSAESIRWAYTRLEDFYSIHEGGDFLALTDAVTTLMTSVGLDEEIAAEFCGWVNEFVGDGLDIPVSLGLLIGLLAADHEKW